MIYYRPVARFDYHRPEGAFTLAGGWCWFDTVAVLSRDGAPRLVAASEIPDDVLAKLTSVRPAMAGLTFETPKLMGILNVTPDSFSDGGQHNTLETALAHARQMHADGADILDIGGESTRPGAQEVPVAKEIDRTSPVIHAIRADLEVPISIDTRKTPVARAAYEAGANLVNDVAGFTFDPTLGPFCAEQKLPVCVMHAQGTPETMQIDPRYSNVALDVYDYLAERIETLVALGISREAIIVDPGIGFGKTQAHNLELMRNLSLFHALGCPVLLGVSRKRFIGDIGNAHDPLERTSGSIAAGLAGIAQGIQVLRIHDVAQTRSALNLWFAST